MLDQDHPENFEELKKHWPFGLFPVLLDDGKPVIETTCIIDHLQAHHPGQNIGSRRRCRARVRFLDRFFDLYVMNNMSVPVFNAIRPGGIARPVRRRKSDAAPAALPTTG